MYVKNDLSYSSFTSCPKLVVGERIILYLIDRKNTKQIYKQYIYQYESQTNPYRHQT